MAEDCIDCGVCRFKVSTILFMIGSGMVGGEVIPNGLSLLNECPLRTAPSSDKIVIFGGPFDDGGCNCLGRVAVSLSLSFSHFPIFLPCDLLKDDRNFRFTFGFGWLGLTGIELLRLLNSSPSEASSAANRSSCDRLFGLLRRLNWLAGSFKISPTMTCTNCSSNVNTL